MKITPGQECFEERKEELPEEDSCKIWKDLSTDRQQWWERLAEWFGVSANETEQSF